MHGYMESPYYLVIFHMFDSPRNTPNGLPKEELATLNKFKISGFDIYDRMLDKIHDLIWDLDYDISQEDLDRIKPLYIKLYDQKSWEDIQKWFDNKREYGN